MKYEICEKSYPVHFAAVVDELVNWAASVLTRPAVSVLHQLVLSQKFHKDGLELLNGKHKWRQHRVWPHSVCGWVKVIEDHVPHWVHWWPNGTIRLLLTRIDVHFETKI